MGSADEEVDRQGGVAISPPPIAVGSDAAALDAPGSPSNGELAGAEGQAEPAEPTPPAATAGASAAADAQKDEKGLAPPGATELGEPSGPERQLVESPPETPAPKVPELTGSPTTAAVGTEQSTSDESSTEALRDGDGPETPALDRGAPGAEKAHGAGPSVQAPKAPPPRSAPPPIVGVGPDGPTDSPSAPPAPPPPTDSQPQNRVEAVVGSTPPPPAAAVHSEHEPSIQLAPGVETPESSPGGLAREDWSDDTHPDFRRRQRRTTKGWLLLLAAAACVVVVGGGLSASSLSGGTSVQLGAGAAEDSVPPVPSAAEEVSRASDGLTVDEPEEAAESEDAEVVEGADEADVAEETTETDEVEEDGEQPEELPPAKPAVKPTAVPRPRPAAARTRPAPVKPRPTTRSTATPSKAVDATASPIVRDAPF